MISCMAAIPTLGKVCDKPAIARLTMACTRVSEHRVTAEVCEEHETHATDAMFCRPCYDQLYDKVRLKVAAKIALNQGARPSGLILP